MLSMPILHLHLVIKCHSSHRKFGPIIFPLYVVNSMYTELHIFIGKVRGGNVQNFLLLSVMQQSTMMTAWYWIEWLFLADAQYNT